MGTHFLFHLNSPKTEHRGWIVLTNYWAKNFFLTFFDFGVKFWLFQDTLKGWIHFKDTFRAQKWLGKLGIRTCDHQKTWFYYWKLQNSNQILTYPTQPNPLKPNFYRHLRTHIFKEKWPFNCPSSPKALNLPLKFGENVRMRQN